MRTAAQRLIQQQGRFEDSAGGKGRHFHAGTQLLLEFSRAREVCQLEISQWGLQPSWVDSRHFDSAFRSLFLLRVDSGPEKWPRYPGARTQMRSLKEIARALLSLGPGPLLL